MLPGVTNFFEAAQKKTGGTKAPKYSNRIKKQRATKPKPQRIEPIEDICEPCLNGNNYGQEEVWGLPREELCRISRDFYKHLPEFKKKPLFYPCQQTGKEVPAKVCSNPTMGG